MIKILIITIFSIYPVIVYFGLTYLGSRSVVFLVIGIAAIRFTFFRTTAKKNPLYSHLILALTTSVLLGALVLISGSKIFLLYYPVLMNAMMFLVFSASLLRPPSMIERFARLRHTDLDESGVTYTRKVTIVWAAFFLVNGSIAFYTSRNASLEVWTIYNGCIAYLLMALLFACEYLVRKRVQRKNSAAGFSR